MEGAAEDRRCILSFEWVGSVEVESMFPMELDRGWREREGKKNGEVEEGVSTGEEEREGLRGMGVGKTGDLRRRGGESWDW